MRKVKLYIAMSADGKIAKEDGSVDWLHQIPNPDNDDYGYSSFYQTIDITLQGYNTYSQVMSFDIPFPYQDKKNYVFTRDTTRTNTQHVTFVSSQITEFVHNLKQQEGGDIWLIGGSQLNTVLINAGLIDHIQLFVMPAIIGRGIPLFTDDTVHSALKLIDRKEYASGVVELHYEVGSRTV